MTFKMKRYLLLLLIIAGSLLCAMRSMAEDFKDFSEVDLEALLNTEVTTASRFAQKITNAPNAIYVITEEFIKRSGAITVPDLLRMVPGVDVVNCYGNAYGLSARSFNDRFAQRMLVMIDGRSIYTNFFGGVFWEDDQVFLEDIKRIEVIRGPGATMWGANAVNGVINIITKDPEEDPILMITGKAGSQKFREGVARYSGKVSDKLSLSVTGGYHETDGISGVTDYRSIPKFTGRAKYKLSDESVLQFFAGFIDSDNSLEKTRYTPRTGAPVRSNYQMVRWEHRFSDTSQVSLQTYHDHAEVHSPVVVEEDKYDVELQHALAIGERNHMVYGGNYRTITVDSNLLSPETNQDDILAFFVQDELTVTEKLRFVAGIKFEKNSLTGVDWSPRGCILYAPWENQQFRFSVSRAFRTPGFVEDSAYTITRLPLTDAVSIPVLSTIGNQHLKPEQMTAFELGYRTALFNRVGLNIELYYNELDNTIENVVKKRTFPLEVSWDKVSDSVAKGIEVAADYFITPWWQVSANYTFQEVEYKKYNRDVPGTPRNKCNLWSSFTFNNGITFDVIAHYVDKTKWSGLSGVLEDVKVDDYVRLDMRIAKKLCNNSVEIALVGQNLTDKRHVETSDGVGTFDVGQLIYGQMTFYFK